MIRLFEKKDMDQVLNIWLNASVKAHDFVEKKFWESKVADMRDIYLPSGEIYVYDEDGVIKGFLALCDDTLAAVFISPKNQGEGIGRQLMAKAKEVRNNLNLTVYKKNKKSIKFYKKCGFKIAKEQVDEHTGELELLMTLNNSSNDS